MLVKKLQVALEMVEMVQQNNSKRRKAENVFHLAQNYRRHRGSDLENSEMSIHILKNLKIILNTRASQIGWIFD